MLKYVILNGPPGCGKDTIAEYLAKEYTGVEQASFKHTLFELTCNYYGVSRAFFDAIYTRELKEVPSDALGGKSPRQALIHVSEDVIKPMLGKDFFGRAFVDNFNNHGKLYIVSDGGFEQELVPLIEAVGSESILVIKLFRKGCTFDGDSRNYLSDKFLQENGVRVKRVYNNSTKDYVFKMVFDAICDSI